MKMFLQIVLIIVVIIVLIYLSFYFARNLLAPKYPISSFSSVCIGEKCFTVELAQTEAEKSKGLMYRDRLDKDKGMLFIYDNEGMRSFWMKNTLIPLDIIWIDKNYKVVSISQYTQPCKSLICPSILPVAKAKYVLEINAGLCEENNIKLNDIVNIKIN